MPLRENVTGTVTHTCAPLLKGFLQIMTTHDSVANQRMTLEELSAIGHAIFGGRWMRPLARAIGWSPRALRFWKDGERPVSVEATRAIRAFSELGEVGEIVRAAVQIAIPRIKARQAHAAARQALVDLAKAGLLDGDRATRIVVAIPQQVFET